MTDSERTEKRFEYRLDEIDRRIIYGLMTDARTGSAPKIADLTASEAVEEGRVNDDPLVALEREGDIITPHGDTHVRPDVVPVFPPDSVDDRTVRAFIGSETTDPSSPVHATSRESTEGR